MLRFWILADPPSDKLSNIVRSLQYPPYNQYNDPRATPIPWDQAENGRRGLSPDIGEYQRPHPAISETLSQPHVRNESNGTTKTSVTGSAAPTNGVEPQHKQYGNSVETLVASTRSSAVKNPIQPPSIVVRSEYPTLTRSRHQQSLTCLITVEVAEGKWQPDFGGMQDAQDPPIGSSEPAHISPPPSTADESAYEHTEPPEELEKITEELHSRVDNWHGLDFSR